MNKSFLIKALANGVITWFVVSLIFSLIRSRPFGQLLTRPYNILIGICAAVGSYIGYMIRAKK